MNTSRGFIFPLLMIIIIVSTGVVVAWWLRENTATPAPTSQVGQSAPAANKDLVVSPTSGPPPLRVQFAVLRDLGTIETIDYGDGSSGTVTSFICGLQYCTKVHTYDRTGVYTAVFESGSGQALRSFTITVTPSP